jgi:signal peptidase I
MEETFTQHPPPPLSSKKKFKWKKALLATAILIPLFLGLLQPLGLQKFYTIPTRGMSPAVDPGDHILMEGWSFLAGKPGRGDIIVFRTGGIAGIVSPPSTPPEGQDYIKRLVGLPGDQLLIADGKLHVNGLPVKMTNERGEIEYTNLGPYGDISNQPLILSSPSDTVAVPADHFYVLGDNSPNSADSRFWGFVPASNVKGKAFFRYWPLGKTGAIH